MQDLYTTDSVQDFTRALHERAAGRDCRAGMATGCRTEPYERHKATDEERDEREQRYRRRHAANGWRSIALVDGQWCEFRYEQTAAGRWEPVLD